MLLGVGGWTSDAMLRRACREPSSFSQSLSESVDEGGLDSVASGNTSAGCSSKSGGTGDFEPWSQRTTDSAVDMVSGMRVTLLAPWQADHKVRPGLDICTFGSLYLHGLDVACLGRRYNSSLGAAIARVSRRP